MSRADFFRWLWSDRAARWFIPGALLPLVGFVLSFMAVPWWLPNLFTVAGVGCSLTGMQMSKRQRRRRKEAADRQFEEMLAEMEEARRKLAEQRMTRMRRQAEAFRQLNLAPRDDGEYKVISSTPSEKEERDE